MAGRSGRTGELSPETKEAMIHEKIVDEQQPCLGHDLSFDSSSLPPSHNSSTVSPSSSYEKHDITTPPTKQQQQEGHEGDKGGGQHDDAFYEGTGGCSKCGADDDHANLLICEACNGEFHTYCLDPPLRCVPDGDFFCDKCKPLQKIHDCDGLDTLINALPPSITSRFGEIIWAAGGVGFGWWPACIYDPRLTVGGARTLAKKHLGKKHLVYFFECHDAPFTVLGNSKIVSWEEGFLEEFDLGKASKAMGKQRSLAFEQALQLATVEYNKPIELRLEWNHTGKNVLQPAAKNKPTNTTPAKGRKKDKKKNATDTTANENKENIAQHQNDSSTRAVTVENDDEQRSSSSSLPIDSNNKHQWHDITDDSSPAKKRQKRDVILKRGNIEHALRSLVPHDSSNSDHNNNKANEIEISEDGTLFLKILLKPKKSFVGTSQDVIVSTNVGFVTLPSRRNCTFEDARQCISSDLDEEDEEKEEESANVSTKNKKKKKKKWKFYVPGLGPMSYKQERKLGPMLDFLKSTTDDPRLGDGTGSNPLKVVIVELGTSAGAGKAATSSSPCAATNAASEVVAENGHPLGKRKKVEV